MTAEQQIINKASKKIKLERDKKITRNMLNEGLDAKLILKTTGLKASEVRKLKEEL